jgi:hypothetical protein
LLTPSFFVFGDHRFEHRSASVAMAPFKQNNLTQLYTAPVCTANFSIDKKETHLLLQKSKPLKGTTMNLYVKQEPTSG